MSQSTEYLSVVQVATLLHLSEFQVRNLLRSGRLRGFHPGKRWLVKPEAVKEYVERGHGNG